MPCRGGRGVAVRANWIRRGLLLLLTGLVALGLAACGDSDGGGDAGGTLRIGAIPDQDPEVLQRQFGLVSDYLAEELGVDVEYVPVTDYQSAVSGFAVGDLDLVWFGGLTGVQARLEVDGAAALVQRDIDAQFTSVFIAGTDVDIEPEVDIVVELILITLHSDLLISLEHFYLYVFITDT